MSYLNGFKFWCHSIWDTVEFLPLMWQKFQLDECRVVKANIILSVIYFCNDVIVLCMCCMQLAFKYLSWLLYPLLVGYAIYSVLYLEHRGWYSWVLSMLYGFLLTFGKLLLLYIIG